MSLPEHMLVRFMGNSPFELSENPLEWVQGKYILKEMTEMEKPREKLLRIGPNALADYELLAIILRTGTKNKSVINLAIDILNQLNSINDLNNITIEELLKFEWRV